jgi:ABC-type antimicrobial peptide transport system permease subunit
MNLALVLKRTRREWRQFAILIVAICLVTAFFAMGPLYTRAMVQSSLQFTLARDGAQATTMSFISSQPYKADADDLIRQHLGALDAGLVHVSRSAEAFRGFAYQPGRPTTRTTPQSRYGYRAYAFSNIREILRLRDGRWPERLAPPDPAATEDQRMNSQGDLEAVITPEVAGKTGYGIDTRFVIGQRPEDRAVVRVVGIVEAANLDDPIWDSNEYALNGEEIQQTQGQEIYNMGFIVTEEAFADWVARATSLLTAGDNNTFIRQIALNIQTINADNVNDVQASIRTLVSRMTTEYPGLITLNPLLRLLNSYTDQLARTDGPILILSGAILILMLYHLVTTVALVLEQQTAEWASMTSRGASILQLIALQGLSMALLGLIGFVAGPFLAVLLLDVLTQIGPLSTTTSGTGPIGRIPDVTFRLSAIAAVASVIVLTLPAIPAARRSLTQFKQIVSRPPTRPAWARYSLDVILILVGIGFLARLLFFVGGDLAQTLTMLANEPRRLIQLLIDSANRAGGLGDPLNLIGPALLLTGVALLWLRLFPSLIRVIGKVIARLNTLTGPLAVWNVERDPGHYAQLVLLLIGTLALGTAALSLVATRDSGTWTAARLATGGAARIDFDTKTGQPNQANWNQFPGVTAATTLTRAETDYVAGQYQIFLIGVEPGDMTQDFPELSSAVSPLVNQNVVQNTVPVVMSARMAQDEGRATHSDGLPLEVGATGQVELLLGGKTPTLQYKIVGITRFFPSVVEVDHFLIMDRQSVEQIVNAAVAADARVKPNQVWLEIPARQPTPALESALRSTPGVTKVVFAWDRLNALLREPLPAAIAGMLYAGFWISLLLSLLDFAFYLAVTARRRSMGFAVLRALGWNASRIWALLVAEQATLVIPALLVGVALGTALAYVILPFLALVGGETLRLPLATLASLLLALLVGFGILLIITALWLRRLDINRVMRLGEE